MLGGGHGHHHHHHHGLGHMNPEHMLNNLLHGIFGDIHQLWHFLPPCMRGVDGAPGPSGLPTMPSREVDIQPPIA
eukprot:gene9058-3117_t